MPVLHFGNVMKNSRNVFRMWQIKTLNYSKGILITRPCTLKRLSGITYARIGQKYRALAVEIEEGLLWFWIGAHTEYDNLLK